MSGHIEVYNGTSFFESRLSFLIDETRFVASPSFWRMNARKTTALTVQSVYANLYYKLSFEMRAVRIAPFRRYIRLSGTHTFSDHNKVEMLDDTLKTCNSRLMKRMVASVILFALCNALVTNGEDLEAGHFIEVSADHVAFPDVELIRQTDPPLRSRKDGWSFSMSHEPGRQVLRAESGDKSVIQSITPDAVHKRFVFDMKRQRFEPMRQEIRIEQTNDRKLRQIKRMYGVTAVKRYENLGFSIVKIAVDVNPVEVFRTLKDEFASDNARILTGFFEYEPM